MNYTHYLVIFCLVLLSCGRKKESETKKTEDITNKEVVLKKEFPSLDLKLDFKYKSKSFNNSYWMPMLYIINLNAKGPDDFPTRNNESYPYEFIHIKNWKKKDIYCNSTKFEYRKMRVEEINDSTYYLTSFNTHHYKAKDSIFLAKRNNQLNIITSFDSIPYCTGIGRFDFDDLFLYRLQKNIYLYKKKYHIYNSIGNLLEENISFNLSEMTIENSKLFSVFTNTSNSNYIEIKGEKNIRTGGIKYMRKHNIKLDNHDWFFYIKEENLYFEENNTLKYVFKRV